MPIKRVHNEPELLISVAEGNEKAFAKLFHAYHNQLGAYIMLLTDSMEMAEEIVQDVFVKIWINRATLPTIGNFSSYLFILTRNYTLNCIRKIETDRKRQLSYTSHLVRTGDQDPAVGERSADHLDIVERAVAQLPPQQQRVFNLKREGRKNSEIAREMGISPDSVKKYQQWAVKSIAEFMRTHQELGSLIVFFSLLKK